MCGITGYWTAGGTAEVRSIGPMTGALQHRGPDDRGTYVDEAAGLVLGFCRLSIIDLSEAGHQPMTSADGRYVIVYNGEIYNHTELGRELAREGIRFRGHSDTEVLLEACAAWGVEATLKKLIGMFAFALWDRLGRQVVLARDRLGIKPLFYGVRQGTLLFGSELKALIAHPAGPPTIDEAAVAAFLRLGYVPAPRSIYQHVHKLLPGHAVTFGTDLHPRLSCYWDAVDVARAGLDTRLDLDDAEAVAALDERLRDAVGRRMIADVPLGAFLSGGIDSTAVVALMQAQSSRPVRTFTLGFENAGYDEAQHARAVATHLGTEHTEVRVSASAARDVIPHLADIYDEPFADSSQIPTYLVSRIARQHVTVALSGDGGDEVFGGYHRHLWGERLWRRARLVPRALRSATARLATSVPPAQWDRVYGRLQPVLLPGVPLRLAGERIHKLARVLEAVSADDVYRRLVSLWPPGARVHAREAAEEPSGLATRVRVVPGMTERMMLLDQVTYLPDDILAKVDRASMAVSLEVRVPLLDHRNVEWAWRLPFRFKQRDGVGKWLLRQVAYQYVPRDVLERPKSGFGIPLEDWLRGPLRGWAEALLDEKALREDGWIRPEPVRQAWCRHLQGRDDHHHQLWTVLMFQAWRQRWRTGIRS